MEAQRSCHGTKLGSLHVGTVEYPGLYKGSCRICIWWMRWLFEAHSLWWEAFLSLDAARRALVLPQLNVLMLHGRPYSLWGVDGEWFAGKCEGVGWGGKLWLVCKKNKDFKRKQKVPSVISSLLPASFALLFSFSKYELNIRFLNSIFIIPSLLGPLFFLYIRMLISDL